MSPLFVIDDDPTGAQAESEVELLLEWSVGDLQAAAQSGVRAVHLLTNSRAMPENEAYRVVRDAVENIQVACPGAELVLRGDSTLRAHFLTEHAAACDGLGVDHARPVLLIPALPAAGRVTIGGRHYLTRGEQRVGLEDTEFSKDGVFAYSTARLLDWAHERSAGYFQAADGQEIGLAGVRGAGGPGRICAALERAASCGRPAVVVPDAETQTDLELIAQGLRLARASRIEPVVRCAPAFVGTLAGTSASGWSPLPAAPRGILLAAGSHVPTTTRQLEALRDRYPAAYVEVMAKDLVNGHSKAVVRAAADAARARLADGRLAIVATSRETLPGTLGFVPGMRVARNLAAIVREVYASADVVVSKGGITSAVNAAEGLSSARARVVGPIAPGISLWQVSSPDGGRPFIVVPGNVGDDRTLVELVTQLLEV